MPRAKLGKSPLPFPLWREDFLLRLFAVSLNTFATWAPQEWLLSLTVLFNGIFIAKAMEVLVARLALSPVA